MRVNWSVFGEGCFLIPRWCSWQPMNRQLVGNDLLEIYTAIIIQVGLTFGKIFSHPHAKQDVNLDRKKIFSSKMMAMRLLLVMEVISAHQIVTRSSSITLMK